MLTFEQAPDGFNVRRIAAQNPVFTQHPEIAANAHRALRCFRYRVLIRQAGTHLVRIRQQLAQFLVAEPNHAKIEVLEL